MTLANDHVPDSIKKTWRRPDLRKLPIEASAASGGKPAAGIANDGNNKKNGDSGQHS